MKYLCADQVIYLHDEIILISGGLPGLRDVGLLESALETPKMHFFGVEICDTFHKKSMSYLFHIIKNHPFFDANKRTAFESVRAFHKINGVQMSMLEDWEKLCVLVADGTIGKEDLFKIKY